ncbi:MAG: hypothetical protein EHM85_11905 [Desulfobacteraceae bacterium]|nr:MAG: hypothetical protein EHM85_11905 [Desulfobacteraceae bacterium]
MPFGRKKIEKLSQFFNTIPVVEREILREYRFGRWHILKMLGSCGAAALDLYNSNPTLAFALALARYLGSGNNNFYRSLRALLHKRQREIIGWMGFSDSKKQGIVNIFIKINPFAIRHIQDFWRLRSIMNEQPNITKMMFFLERINTDIFRIVTDPALVRYVTPDFLDEVSYNKESEIIPRVAYKLKRTIEMLPVNRNVKFKSLTHLQKIWGELADHECRICLIMDRDINFCPPPFPAFVGESLVVEPLTCSRSLAEESIEQENCIIDYVNYVLDEEGQIYIYKVIKPERATLSIVNENGYFIVDELKGRKNRDVSQMTSCLVSNWLKNVQHDYC